MLDALILEDFDFYRERMQAEIAPGMQIAFATNSAEYRSILKSSKARMYFLDDVVPDLDGENKFLFLTHCPMLLRLYPDAKTYYIGSNPGTAVKQYCARNKIEIIQRDNVARIINGKD
jgi:hypothetical protein